MNWKRRTGLVLFGIVGLGSAGLVNVAHSGDEVQPRAELSLWTADTVIDECLDVRVTLDNRGDVPLYLSPVLGQMCGKLWIFAESKTTSSQRPVVLYKRTSGDFGCGPGAFEDLFRLLPGRRLALDLTLCSPLLEDLGDEIELWAELDTRPMSQIDARAFQAIVVSDRVVFRDSRLGQARELRPRKH